MRFAIAAALLWALEAARRERGSRPGKADVLAALALGAVCYALQAGLFFAALERIDASLAVVLLYTSPAIVAVAAVVLGRERLAPAHGRGARLASGGVCS